MKRFIIFLCLVGCNETSLTEPPKEVTLINIPCNVKVVNVSCGIYSADTYADKFPCSILTRELRLDEEPESYEFSRCGSSFTKCERYTIKECIK